MNLSRRNIVQQGTALIAGFGGLKSFVEKADASSNPMTLAGYGTLQSDPQKTLDLPKGFSYKEISGRGELMDDGLFVPGQHDGMGAFPGPDGKVILVRNHELNPSHSKHSAFGSTLSKWRNYDSTKAYDPGTKKQLGGYGGTTTILYNPKTQKVDKQFLSLSGTEWNCAGGVTPWGSWISCEETVSTRSKGLYSKDHGYNFEVPASINQVANPIPLIEMGRFRHEAIAVEPKSGIVYQTEDRHDGLIYRFIPRERGMLESGGRLQALCIRIHKSMDTRNWRSTDRKKSPNMPISKWIPTSWVNIDSVESPDDSLRKQGFAKGAAVFARSEGMWYGNNSLYWACTNGGPFMKGQIFRYIPSQYEGTLRENTKPGMVQLYIQSHSSKVLENCDNLTVAPWGDLFICEDHQGSGGVVRVTKKGEISKFAENHYSSSELAGACFSPDGKTLFLNLHKDGKTFAITGPWRRS